MSYEAKVIADSIGPNLARITTFQLRFPRMILAQFNTHRSISKNARSSRAVPVERLIAEVESDPVIPIYWGKNQRGMQATKELDAGDIDLAERHWLIGRDDAVYRARRLMEFGVHKQIANRLLEPFLWVDVVATATDWANFFTLRCDSHAQPEIQKLAVMMARAHQESEPYQLEAGWWHLPYIEPEALAGLCEERSLDDPDLIGEHEHRLVKRSVARCGRVSYRAFDGSESPIAKDVEFHDQLVSDGHWSPTEHQAEAQASHECHRSGNFLGWDQYRQRLSQSVHHTFDYTALDQFDERGFVLTEAQS